jgi:hypothetical protein
VDGLPVCPFCRKSVDLSAVWCECGANLSRFPSLPASPPDVRPWLMRHVPDMLQAKVDGRKTLINQARERLIESQDAEIKESNRQQAEMAAAQKVFSNFLADCSAADFLPTVDLGKLRRDRWRQWKRVPAEYRQHPPLRSFRETPGYIFTLNIAKHKDEFCLALDGTLYKHQLNAPDPYPLEEILKFATVQKIAESMIVSLLALLQARQHPMEELETEVFEQIPEAPAPKSSRFNRKKTAADADAEEGLDAEQPPVEAKAAGVNSTSAGD